MARGATVRRLRHPFIAAQLLATTVAICACSGGDTANSSDGGAPVTTPAMYISATVEAEDELTTEISVSLHSGDPLFGTHFQLTGGDELRACVGAQCSPLTLDSGVSKYEADLPYAAETTYTISLTRAAGPSAPNSVVALPVPFAILTPAPGLRVTDGDSVTVQWAPAGVDEVVDVWAETRCDHENHSLFIPVLLRSLRRGRLAENVDSGAVVADVDTLLDSGWVLFRWDDPIVRCEIAIEVLHQRVGTIDALFGGGSIHGVVSRKVTLDYTPGP
jgi:hypothetical protein